MNTSIESSARSIAVWFAGVDGLPDDADEHVAVGGHDRRRHNDGVGATTGAPALDLARELGMLIGFATLARPCTAVETQYRHVGEGGDRR